MRAQVKVSGWREIQASLGRAGRSLDSGFKRAAARAAQPIIAGARWRASTRMERSVAATLRAVPSRAGVAIETGDHPYTMGAEFGAHRERQRRRRTGSYVGYRQFRPWKGSGGSSGYFLYPSIRANSDKVVQRYLDELDALLRRSGL